ncbi:hypothetical protein FSP39_013962 [Pinctada imbricata]|uniref:ATP-dependent DNA helicase n=1 Tax=Pinctada imbricata TaxID=66713 RepID=A0AA89C3S9_PINIB|nr:hypothetical protein FSP39_013962 [Pinctada imbricata]
MDEQQFLVYELIVKGHNVVVCGQAGTGKTFLVKETVKYFKSIGKSYALTATTGLAASLYGDGACTLHKWMGMEDGRHSNDELIHLLRTDERLEKPNENIKNTDVLIIDEASMLSAKTLSQVEVACRQIRENDRYFGGMQVVLSGDFYQLPPVRNELYGDYGHYCFTVKWFNSAFPHKPCLGKIYRQDDPLLVKAVNELEQGTPSTETIAMMQSLARPLADEQREKAIHLFARNDDVLLYNYKKIQSEPGQLFVFKSSDDGDRHYLDKIPAPKQLGLKVNSPVMLLVNLSNQLVNGKIGHVNHIEGEDIFVTFIVSGRSITVKINKYVFTKFDPVEKRNIAKREQFPLNLAYALTIHKAQGLTIDNLIIDCKNAFSPGQIGVAVGRARSVEGLCVLNFKKSLCRSHPANVRQFYETCGVGNVSSDMSCCSAEIEKEEKNVQKAVEYIDDNKSDDDDDDNDDDDDINVDSGVGKEDEFDSDIELDIILSVDDIERKDRGKDGIDDIFQESIEKYTDTQIINHVINLKSEVKKNPDPFLKTYDHHREEIMKKAKEIFPHNKSEFSASNFRSFYTQFQTHLASEFFRNSVKNDVCKKYKKCGISEETSFRTFSNCMFKVQKDILREINDRSTKEVTDILPRIDVNLEISGPGRGKIRYIAGYVVAKLKYRNARTLRNSLFVMDKTREVSQGEMKMKLLESLSATDCELSDSVDPESLIETRRRQNIAGSLTNVTEEAYQFFTQLEQSTRKHLTYVNLYEQKSEFFTAVETAVLNDNYLFTSLSSLFTDELIQGHGSDHSNTNICDSSSRCNICKAIRDLHSNIMSLFVKVSVSQFRRDFLSALRVEKGKALRERVSIRKEKKSSKIFDFEFIKKDFTEEKMTSHLRLQSELKANPKYLSNFCNKSNLLLLCTAYGLTVAKNKSKNEISETLSQKIMNSSKMTCIQALCDDASAQIEHNQDPLPSTSHDPQPISEDTHVLDVTQIASTSTEKDPTHTTKSVKRKQVSRKGKGKGKKSKSRIEFPCGICDQECVTECIACDTCDTWFHADCLNMNAQKLDELEDKAWYCDKCSSGQ